MLDNQETLALNNNYALKINNLPGVSFNCVQASIPGFTFESLKVESPFRPVPKPGTKITPDPFVCRFLVDEDYENWFSILDWVYRLRRGEADVSDFSVVLPKVGAKGGRSIRYTDAFPTSLETIDLLSTVTKPEVLTCGMILEFTDLEVEQA